VTEKDSVSIRAESPDDRAAVFAVNRAAFESDAEARLVDRLRLEADPVVSLVAEVDACIVGHILFSPATLSADAGLFVMGLGPMAVVPGQQNRGIGSALVRAGLDRCRDLGCEAVFVLGHPLFYPRFGFESASTYAISSDYDLPDEVFMALELAPVRSPARRALCTITRLLPMSSP
jgi:putative acetyltransferase